MIKSSLLNVCACVNPTVAVVYVCGDGRCVWTWRSLLVEVRTACGSCFCLSPISVLRLELWLSGLAASPVTHWSISLALVLLALILWLWWWVWSSLLWDFLRHGLPVVAHRDLELSILVLGPWGVFWWWSYSWSMLVACLSHCCTISNKSNLKKERFILALGSWVLLSAQCSWAHC